ncbi:MAG: 3-hydroxyacyl-CoA dehydrogenase NAD-binding domain-containing protein [Tomitella sp.]|nr:3-hydroxyacyl-CoA dehydrogenase NAD-binding domain-containing protein [Tomitella sp.]
MSEQTGTTTIGWERDADGIVTLTMDDPTSSANTMTDLFGDSFAKAVERIEAEREDTGGVIIASAKDSFFAGGDLSLLMNAGPGDEQEIAARLDRLKDLFRRLETLGVPVVAAINGAALGGGYEIALACHHRIVLDRKSTVVGLPEVTLGLLPGAGGVTRTVRLFGVQTALSKVLLTGSRYRPADALELGMVDDVVDTPERLMAAAKAWIADNPNAVQPWDREGYRIPGGTPASPSFAGNLPAIPATVRKQLKGSPVPGPRNIISAAVEGTQVDIGSAGRIETRYLVELVCGPYSTNMIKALFFDMEHLNRGGARPEGHPRSRARRVVVLGAGMMGAGIAYVTARSGADVVLKDVSEEAAARGKEYSAKLLVKAVSRGKMTESTRDEILARIIPTGSYEDCAGADFVVEAVFESPDLKKQVFANAEKAVAPDALLGSNTSTLPITDLAAGVQRPEDFIGLHFFSPVDKMPLVEIVVGEKTSDAAIARAIDYTLQIGKTPILVNDSRGFFTSRVIGMFMDEAVQMVGAGVEPASVEQAALQAGYPAPALQLLDELTLTLPLKIRAEMKSGLAAESREYDENGADVVLERLVEDFDRKGRSSGAGFYEYDEDGKRARLWPGLRDAFGSGSTRIPFEDMKERMLFAEAVDTIRCFDEGVLRTVAEANVGSILGIGFPAWTGGVVQYIENYAGGPAGFVERARELESRYGSRFTVPQSLVDAAAAGGRVEDRLEVP